MELINKLRSSNIGGGKFIEIVDVRDVLNYYPPTGLTIGTEVELKPDAEWKIIRFTDETLHFIENEDRETGDTFYKPLIDGIIAKDRVDILSAMLPFLKQRVLVKYHDLNDNIYLVGTPDEPLMVARPARNHKANYQDRNEVYITISGGSKKQTPFYGGDVYVPPAPSNDPQDLIIVNHFAAGNDTVEWDATVYEVGTIDSHSDDGGSGAITYEIDTGGGYATATPPYSIAAGNSLKMVRANTAGIGWALQTGNY